MTDAQKYLLLKIRRDVVDRCKVCGGVGYLRDDKKGDRSCDCMKVFRWIMALVISRMPRYTWDLMPLADGVIDSEAVRKVRHYVSHIASAISTGSGITFVGPNGVGKTVLMCEVGKTILAAGYSVYYVTAAEYIVATQPSRPDDALIKTVQNAEVILLDELDKPYAREGSDYVARTLEALIRQSIMFGKVLIVATNASPKELASAYGESVASALERCTEVIPVGGVDLSRKTKRPLGESFDYQNKALKQWALQYHDSTYTVIKEL